MNQIWEDIKKMCLLGSSSGYDESIVEARSKELELSQKKTAEKALLSLVTVEAQIKRTTPYHFTTIDDDRSPWTDELRSCPAPLASLLEQIMNSQTDFLEPTLRIFTDNMVLLPPELLPDLFEISDDNVQLQALIAQCMGPAGRYWIEKKYPSLSYLFPLDEPVQYAGQRFKQLIIHRLVNEELDFDEVESEVKKWNAKNWTTYLELIKDRLVESDHAFLNYALDHGSDLNKVKAFHLFIKSTPLEVDVLLRDFFYASISIGKNKIELKESYEDVHVIFRESNIYDYCRAYVDSPVELLSYVSIERWQEWTGYEKKSFWEAIQAVEEESSCFDLVIQSAILHNDEYWLTIISFFLIKKEMKHPQIEEIVSAMSAENFQKLATAWLKCTKDVLDTDDVVYKNLITRHDSWTRELSGMLIDKIHRMIVDEELQIWERHKLNDLWAACCKYVPSSMAEVLTEKLRSRSDTWPGWLTEIEYLIEQVALRKVISDAL